MERWFLSNTEVDGPPIAEDTGPAKTAYAGPTANDLETEVIGPSWNPSFPITEVIGPKNNYR